MRARLMEPDRSGQPSDGCSPVSSALAIAGVGLIGLDRRRVTLLVIGVTGFVISLGLNTPLYEPLRSVLFIYRGLRAPARASILVFLALAALAAFGWARLERRLSSARRRPRRPSVAAR